MEVGKSVQSWRRWVVDHILLLRVQKKRWGSSAAFTVQCPFVFSVTELLVHARHWALQRVYTQCQCSGEQPRPQPSLSAIWGLEHWFEFLVIGFQDLEQGSSNMWSPDQMSWFKVNIFLEQHHLPLNFYLPDATILTTANFCLVFD